MDKRKVAAELLRVAKLLTAASRGPVYENVQHDWNSMHDIENGLERAAQEYDVAASYVDKPAARDALKMLKAINDTRKHLRRCR